MPVDIELMFEELKWKDPKLYRMFCRLANRGMTAKQMHAEGETHSKLMTALEAASYANNLEAAGRVHIYNDYENERVVVRKIADYELDGVEV